MTQITITLDDKTLHQAQILAEAQNTTIQGLFEDYLSRLLLKQNKLEVVPPLEDYPEWMRRALFHGGTAVTGRNAEEVLHDGE